MIIKKIKNKKSLSKYTSKGFTLIETLVAIFIIMLSITGPMVFAQSSLRSAYISRDQITASFLAQEGIEAVKHVRDEIILENIDGDAPNDNYTKDWLYDLRDCYGNEMTEACTIDTVYKVNFNNVKVANCSNAGCPPLRYDSTKHQYSYNTAYPASKFTRSIIIQKMNIDGGNNDREAQVIVEVKWDTVLGERKVVVQENIFEWVPDYLLDY